MEIILLNGKTVEVKTKEELFKYYKNCRYPYSDAANALGQGILYINETGSGKGINIINCKKTVKYIIVLITINIVS